MFDKVDVALGDIPKMGPEVKGSERSNIEDDKEADKLDRDRSSKAYTKNNQPTEIEYMFTFFNKLIKFQT